MVLSCDRALAQADRRRPLAAAALVARTISCGICGMCIGLGQVFLRVPRFSAVTLIQAMLQLAVIFLVSLTSRTYCGP